MLQAGGNKVFKVFEKMISMTPFHFKNLTRLSMDAEPEMFLKSVGTGVGFTVLMILAAMLIFRRAEIK